MTWAALEAKLREERVSVAEAASGDRLQTSITLEDPHRESCSTCTAFPGCLSSQSGAQTLTEVIMQVITLHLCCCP